MTDAALDSFRMEARQWLDAVCPPEMRRPVSDETEICWGGRGWTFLNQAQRSWFEAMVSRGWTAPRWPKAYGGGGLSAEEAEILAGELARINARPALESFGLTMLGPALLAFGSEEIKQRFLPPTVRGEIRWCQGYSEPNAGSDLASLQTRGDDAETHIVVNGQKIWTSYGHKSDWMFCLVRTDPGAGKHQGISFILLDMGSKGVTTRPIRLISGESSFCETFFDNVAVPKENIVGSPGEGWTIAKYLLTHERENLAGVTGTSRATDLAALARRHVGSAADGRLRNDGFRSAIVEVEIDETALACLIDRLSGEAVESGRPIGAMSAAVKYFGTELNKRRQELIMDLLGTEALEWRGDKIADDNPAQAWLRSKANSIEGGTSEIMLNIVAKAILKLPEA